MKTPFLPIRSLVTLGLLASLFGSAVAQGVVGDPAAARQKVAMCIGCHGINGYQASFPEVHKVPMISGQSAKYLAAALTAYQKGERKHPTMRGIATTLSEQDISDLSAFYEASGKDVPAPSAQAPAAPSADVQALLSKGNCLACHGEGLNKPIDASYPKLAGQHADYLYVALKSYQVERNPQVGRGNAIMASQVKAFTPAELKVLSKYIGGLPGDLRTVPQPRFR
ncbi:MAG: cytochrome c4 [Burkholderiales bacterium]|nr:cytochrome c4 [Burkholderiales bacterium]MBH2016977.1 cytochrome c4 [Burkholderiales bacterium]